VRILIEQSEISDWGSFLDKLERLRPEAMLIELPNLPQPLDEAIRRIRRTAASPAVIAVHRKTDPETILGAIRAGATEYLYPPIGDNLAKALERLALERQPDAAAGRRGKIVGFFSSKGGCGATTIACHVAVELQQLTKQQVLLADFDLDSGIIGFLMKCKSQYNVLDAVSNINRLDLSYWKALISNGTPGLEIISAPVTASARQHAELERLQTVLGFARSHYDWLIVDLGRSVSRATLVALEEVDETFLVTTPDVPALYRAKHVARTLLDAGCSRDHMHLILNKISKRTEVTRNEIQEMLGLPVSFTLPDEQDALYEAYTEGHLLPAKNVLAKQMAGIARKLTGNPDPKRIFTAFAL
jgi:pilus assembly protein CpaE